jgi:prepilin-type N-terminal cleavage/methylation domain-containing protein/prepilin-type processing-associated H-X9-DG protein
MKTACPLSRRGFTLVELLVVIVLIAALSVAGFLGYSRIRAAGDRASTLSVVRQLQLANYNYAQDCNNQYVPCETRDPQTGSYVSWHQNSAFLSYLTGDTSAVERGERINNRVPVSILDPLVVRAKGRLWDQLYASYGYNQEHMPIFGPNSDRSFRVHQITDPTRTAAFVTATDHYLKYSGRYLWTKTSREGKSTDGRMAFRHGGKAIVAYYDGSSGFITQDDLKRFDRSGGLNHPFWKANF